MPILTIYTPTYNRETLLPRVFDSLCRQTCKNFIWQVVDDGSTDGTAELVKNWMKQDNGFEIRYFYKENGGVHTARDAAYRLCDTELVTSVDSDDWLTYDAIEKITSFWNSEGGKEYAGVFVPTITDTGETVCSRFPDVHHVTYQDFTYKYKCTGDKHTFLRTDIIKQIPVLPVFAGEKLVGEGFKWIQLPEDKPFLLLNEPISIVEYQSTGISQQVNKNRQKNPNGFRASAKQMLISCKYVKPRIKAQIKYIAYSFILHDKRYIADSPRPLGTILLTPVGYTASLYIKHNE